MRLIALCLSLWPAIAPAAVPVCETALVLAIDVSNSVDTAEYRLQVGGLADALADPEVIDALVRDHVALMVFQWSGETQQVVTQAWARMTDTGAVAAFSLNVRNTPRAIELSDTAPAEAIRFAAAQFGAVPDCRRRVIDVSGDGTPNAGSDTRTARGAAQAAGITINAIAIESLGLAISGFYRQQLITADGFVMTARDHRDYPRALRDKLIRELARFVG